MAQVLSRFGVGLLTADIGWGLVLRVRLIVKAKGKNLAVVSS